MSSYLKFQLFAWEERILLFLQYNVQKMKMFLASSWKWTSLLIVFCCSGLNRFTGGFYPCPHRISGITSSNPESFNLFQPSLAWQDLAFIIFTRVFVKSVFHPTFSLNWSASSIWYISIFFNCIVCKKWYEVLFLEYCYSFLYWRRSTQLILL